MSNSIPVGQNGAPVLPAPAEGNPTARESAEERQREQAQKEANGWGTASKVTGGVATAAGAIAPFTGPAAPFVAAGAAVVGAASATFGAVAKAKQDDIPGAVQDTGSAVANGKKAYDTLQKGSPNAQTTLETGSKVV